MVDTESQKISPPVPKGSTINLSRLVIWDILYLYVSDKVFFCLVTIPGAHFIFIIPNENQLTYKLAIKLRLTLQHYNISLMLLNNPA